MRLQSQKSEISVNTMHIEATIRRVRAFAEAQGWSANHYAKAAGLSPQTVIKMRSPDWSPTVGTLRKLEALIPSEFANDGAGNGSFSE